MNEEMTPWFPPDVFPAYEGVYRVRFKDGSGSEGFAMFTNGEWSYKATTPNKALAIFASNGISPVQGKKWRGLAEKP